MDVNDIDTTERVDTLRQSIAGLRSEVGSLRADLEKLVGMFDARVRALNLDFPLPLTDFKAGAADGTSATPFAGTDPNATVAATGGEQGGAGYGLTESAESAGGSKTGT